MRACRRALAALVAAAAAIGALTVVSGIVPIKASSGHWRITEWFLLFSMQRSIATHAMGIRAPPLDEPWLAMKGAGHYETACRGCHGSPQQPQPVIAQHMLPRPPDLTKRVAERKPAELFYVVKHGVKLTGMPAWPAQQRDDEVWAMVAFLLKLADLDAEGYRQLVDGGASKARATPLVVERSCGRCHGVDGLGRDAPAFPRLAGQRAGYLLAALEAFARGRRHSGIMAAVATDLHPDEMRQLALYYAGFEGAAGSRNEVAAAAIERGRSISERGIPGQRVPACRECHGPADTPRNPAYPVLAGQFAEYLVLQLELFHEERRGGSAYAHLMRPVAGRLTREQMRDAALYYESLGH